MSHYCHITPCVTPHHTYSKYCIHSHHTSLITSKHVAGTPTSLYNDTTSNHTETSTTIPPATTLKPLRTTIPPATTLKPRHHSTHCYRIQLIQKYTMVFKLLSSTAGWCYSLRASLVCPTDVLQELLAKCVPRGSGVRGQGSGHGAYSMCTLNPRHHS